MKIRFFLFPRRFLAHRHTIIDNESLTVLFEKIRDGKVAEGKNENDFYKRERKNRIYQTLTTHTVKSELE